MDRGLDQLGPALQTRVDEILATMEDQAMDPLVRLLQSTRARVLMDVIECIGTLQAGACSTAQQLRRQAAENSWNGHADRQGGAFDDWEIAARRE